MDFGMALPGAIAKPIPSFGKEETKMLYKMLLAAIALGLWANAASTFIRPAHAQNGCECASELSQLDYELRKLRRDVSDIETAVENK
jgi:hypothetical protein